MMAEFRSDRYHPVRDQLKSPQQSERQDCYNTILYAVAKHCHFPEDLIQLLYDMTEDKDKFRQDVARFYGCTPKVACLQILAFTAMLLGNASPLHFVCAALHVPGLGCVFDSILWGDCHMAVCEEAGHRHGETSGRRPSHMF